LVAALIRCTATQFQCESAAPGDASQRGLDGTVQMAVRHEEQFTAATAVSFCFFVFKFCFISFFLFNPSPYVSLPLPPAAFIFLGFSLTICTCCSPFVCSFSQSLYLSSFLRQFFSFFLFLT
jgi:hypothetical protein